MAPFWHAAFGSRLQGMASLPSDLTVMSFNVRYATAPDGEHAWPNRRPHALAMLRRTRPDVLCLQEALRSQIDELEEALPHYGSVGVGREDGIAGGEHAQILFDRGRFDLRAWETFWLSDTPTVPGSITWGNANVRVCTVARLFDRTNSQGLTVYNLHLDHESERARILGSRLVARHAAEDAQRGPVLVVGDFNEDERGPAISALRERIPGLAHAFRSIHPRARRVNTYHGYTGQKAGMMIDHVLAVGLEPKSARIVWAVRYVSDHFPLLCVFRGPHPVPCDNQTQST